MAGAIGAGLQEAAGDAIDAITSDPQRRVQLSGLIAATTVMLVGGDAGAVSTANTTGQDARTYNRDLHRALTGMDGASAGAYAEAAQIKQALNEYMKENFGVTLFAEVSGTVANGVGTEAGTGIFIDTNGTTGKYYRNGVVIGQINELGISVGISLNNAKNFNGTSYDLKGNTAIIGGSVSFNEKTGQLSGGAIGLGYGEGFGGSVAVTCSKVTGTQQYACR